MVSHSDHCILYTTIPVASVHIPTYIDHNGINDRILEKLSKNISIRPKSDSHLREYTDFCRIIKQTRLDPLKVSPKHTNSYYLPSDNGLVHWKIIVDNIQKKGNILRNIKRWRTYRTNLYTCRNPSALIDVTTIDPWFRDIWCSCPKATYDKYLKFFSNSYFLAITAPELLHSFKKLPKHKAPGFDKLTWNIVNRIYATIKDHVLQLFNQILLTGNAPSSLKNAKVVLVHKSGPVTDAKNYRPICLLPLFRKWFESLIWTRIQEKFDNFLDDREDGFRLNRNSRRHIQRILKQISQSKRVVFLDISKAFDTVPLPIVFSELSKIDIDPFVHNIIIDLFSSGHYTIGAHTKEAFRGVMQGSTLGPKRFLLFINTLIVGLKNKFPTVVDCYFADDIALSARTSKILQNILDHCSEFALEHGISFNISKCGSINCCHLQLSHQKIQQVSSYCYLGIPITCAGIDSTSLVTTLTSKISKTVFLFLKFGLTPNGLRYKNRLNAFKAFIVNLINYHLIYLKPKDQSKIKSAIAQSLKGIMEYNPGKCSYDVLLATHGISLTTKLPSKEKIKHLETIFTRSDIIPLFRNLALKRTHLIKTGCAPSVANALTPIYTLTPISQLISA